jgi:hypothetical protein
VTTTTRDYSWLTSFTSPGDARAVVRQPYTISLDGVPHSVATDGLRMVLVPGEHGFPAAPSEVERRFHDIFGYQPKAAPVTLSLAELKQFCGVPVESRTCATCHDSGMVECSDCGGEPQMCECPCCNNQHDIECLRCRDRGETPCPDCKGDFSKPQPARFGVDYFDRSLLARSLQNLSGETVTWQFDRGSRRHVILRTQEWTLFVVPTVVGEVPLDVPEFEPLRATP